MNKTVLHTILHGYIGFFRAFVRVLFFTAFLAGSAMTVSFPLWFWATHHRNSFNLFAGLSIAAGFIFLIAGKVFILSAAIRPLTTVLRLILSAGLVYLCFFLFSIQYYLIASLFSLLTVIIIGLLFFLKKTR